MLKIFNILDIYMQHRPHQRNNDFESASTEEKSRKDIWSKTMHMHISEKFVRPIKLSFEVMDMQSSKEKPDEKNISKEINHTIKNIETQLKELDQEMLIDNQQEDIKLNEVIALGVICCNLGRIYEEKDILSAEKYYLRCIQLLKGKEIHPAAILPVMQAFYGLNSIWLQLINDKKCHNMLTQAVEIYFEYTTEDKYIEPIDIKTILGIGKKKQVDLGYELDYMHLIILKRLTKMYSFNPKDKLEYVTYMHKFFENRVIKFPYFDSFNVSFAFTELSMFFLLNNRFMETRNYLIVADHFAQKFSQNKHEMVDYDDKLIYLNFNIAHSWSRYAFMLLRVSKNKLTENLRHISENYIHEDDDIHGQYKIDCFRMDYNTNVWKPDYFLLFPIVEKNPIIACDYLLNFEQGKIFLNDILQIYIYKQMEFKAKDMSLPGKTILFISRAYKDLWFLTEHEKEKLTMSKKRINFLHIYIEKVMSGVDTSQQIFNLLWLEMGIAYNDHYILKQGSIVLNIKHLTQEVPLNMKILLNNIKPVFKYYLKNC